MLKVGPLQHMSTQSFVLCIRSRKKKKIWPWTKPKTVKICSGVKENSPAALCLLYSLKCLTPSALPVLPILQNTMTLDNKRWFTVWSYYINPTHFLLPSGRKQTTHKPDHIAGSGYKSPNSQDLPVSAVQAVSVNSCSTHLHSKPSSPTFLYKSRRHWE